MLGAALKFCLKNKYIFTFSQLRIYMRCKLKNNLICKIREVIFFYCDGRYILLADY